MILKYQVCNLKEKQGFRPAKIDVLTLLLQFYKHGYTC